MSILITCGAGYIGSHTAKHLSELGREIVVLDNFSTGLCRNARWGALVEGDVSDRPLVGRVLRDYKVDAVMHLAASVHVAESMRRPDLYFENNIVSTKTLLDAMREEGVKRFVFASSSSVYGNTVSEVVKEEEALDPVSPYGESKLTVERMLPWYSRAWGLDWIVLRYFNVAGAEDNLWEDMAVSKRIVPRTLDAVLDSMRALRVYGTTFGTKDGSAVRDFVHVSDVAHANFLAVDWLESGNSGATLNIGAEAGTSVLDIVRTVENELGKQVPLEFHPAREGDPGKAIADATRARKMLGWEARTSSIEAIVASLMRSYGL